MAKESFFEVSKQLKLLEGDNYHAQVLSIEQKLEEFVESKDKQCKSIKQDRTQCILELKNMKLILIKASFEARENYLDYLHKKRKKSLNLEKEKLIKEINSSKKR